MEDRLLKYTNKTETCWIWTGYKCYWGYGIISVKSKPKKAHRIAYEVWKGPIPDGLLIRHLCNNPACINPDHLEIGTHQDNMNDKVRANRQSRNCGPKGTRCATNKLAEEQVQSILQSKEKGRILAQQYGVSEGTISSIRHRRVWKWLDCEA